MIQHTKKSWNRIHYHRNFSIWIVFVLSEIRSQTRTFNNSNKYLYSNYYLSGTVLNARYNNSFKIQVISSMLTSWILGRIEVTEVQLFSALIYRWGFWFKGPLLKSLLFLVLLWQKLLWKICLMESIKIRLVFLAKSLQILSRPNIPLRKIRKYEQNKINSPVLNIKEIKAKWTHK